jgi:hypothetical protein
MKDAFEQLMRESDKEETVPESIAKYVAALVAGTHEITSLTIRPKRTWVGLTGQEKAWIASVSLDVHDAVHRTEAKLKEKNA